MSRFAQTVRTFLAALLISLCSFNQAWAAVNANTASADELQTVRGIGPTIAQRIVDERAKGPYKSLDDLQSRVKGVGNASVKKMAAAGLTTSGSASRAPRASTASRDNAGTSSRESAGKPVQTLPRPGSTDSGRAESPAAAPAPSTSPSSTASDANRPLVQPAPKSDTPRSAPVAASAAKSESAKPAAPATTAAKSNAPKASDLAPSSAAKPGQ